MKEKELKVIQKSREEYKEDLGEQTFAFFLAIMFITLLINFITDLWNFSENYFDYMVNLIIFFGGWILIGFVLAIFFTKRIKLVEKKK